MRVLVFNSVAFRILHMMGFGVCIVRAIPLVEGDGALVGSHSNGGG